MKVKGGTTPVHSAWKLLAGLLLALSVQAPVMAAPQDDAAGRLAGAGLTVDLEPAGDVVLTWEGSCLASDTDYEVYEGLLGDPDTHEARVCTTAGELTWTLTPGPGGRYYLVVPRNATREGSYGRDSAFLERSPGIAPCLPQAFSGCPSSVMLVDIDSGQTSPAGHYRWMDVADQLYSTAYGEGYDYTQSTVEVQFFTGATTFHGLLTASNLKPHFAYQVKLVGTPGTDANEAIGLTGRWWQEEWNGTAWAGGQNLNNKGDGTSPNPNDDTYFGRRDIADPTSPTGLRYRYTAYLVFDYFITGEFGDALLSFDADSSFHVLWKTSQRTPSTQDGPAKTATFDVQLPDPVSAYDTDHPPASATIFGEWERLPMGGVTLPAGSYEAELILTEESFHGGGLAGGWAAAVGAPISFEIVTEAPVVTEDAGFSRRDRGVVVVPDSVCGKGARAQITSGSGPVHGQPVRQPWVSSRLQRRKIESYFSWSDAASP